jgi:uncharacterized protein YtpQ (UPF0354 family)
MFPTPLKTFIHPHSAYRLDYPAHWDQVVKKDGESCGFGPHERDDVGLWISIMPMSVDTDRLQEDLPKLMQQALQNTGAENLRQDASLRNFGLVADMTKEGEGGHYWIVAGGDIVLFASSQVPVAERDVWNPPFLQLMSSLQITRDREMLVRKVANEVLAQLRQRHPEQEFDFDADKIRGRDRVVYLSNLVREVRAAPERRDEIITRFVETLSQPATAELGHEVWEEIRERIVPVLKPRDYVERDGPTQHFLTSEWLSDVLICYAIQGKNMFRFVTGWDVNRWGQTAELLHEQALANLVRLPWPRQLMGSASSKGVGRVIVVDTDDSLASSRLLHPKLHQLFSGPLGSPFCAGIPCRDTLVLYSDRREVKQRINRRLKKDHAASAYPITPRPFLVTRDGIAPQGGNP